MANIQYYVFEHTNRKNEHFRDLFEMLGLKYNSVNNGDIEIPYIDLNNKTYLFLKTADIQEVTDDNIGLMLMLGIIIKASYIMDERLKIYSDK